MKNKVFLLSTIIFAFLAGSLTTYIVMTKQQMDQLMQVKQHQAKSSVVSYQSADSADHLLMNDSIRSNQSNPVSADNQADVISQQINDSGHASINDYSQEQALALVDQMPDYVLDQYIDKFMAKDASDVITDKRRFATRAIEALYQSNDNQPLVGEIKLAASPQMPTTSLDTSTLGKYTKLYAHLDTKGQIPASPFIFIKWINNQSGQVLLFEKKDIVPNSNKNWVSFRPDDGWQEGSYDIRFYQFSSELEPVAQLTYNIYEVNE